MFTNDNAQLGTATSEAIREDLDKVYQQTARRGLSLNLSECQQLTEVAANAARLVGPHEHKHSKQEASVY